MSGHDWASERASERGEANPEPGLYEHYKGSRYRVIDRVRHSESDEELVLYRALYGERGLWVRPLALFLEPVERDGTRCARFVRIGD